MSYSGIFRHAVFVVFAVFLGALPVGFASHQVLAAGLTPASPQPGASALAQGLDVEYMMIQALHVNDLEAAGKGKPGKPLKMLNWDMGSGPILTHVEDEGVGARIRGYIKFEAPGNYQMKMKSNDGVRLSIGGQMVIDDPEVHAAKFSDVAQVSVPSPGWYEVYLLYFERRGTATLELHWQPPGAGGFEFVPASAFAHAPR